MAGVFELLQSSCFEVGAVSALEIKKAAFLSMRGFFISKSNLKES
jgi:hypothetical protein